jgi:hypothetical protein
LKPKKIQEHIIDKRQMGEKVNKHKKTTHVVNCFSDPGASKAIIDISNGIKSAIPSNPNTTVEILKIVLAFSLTVSSLLF